MALLYVLILVFGVLTVVLLNGQGAILVPFYRQLTEEEKEHFRAPAMCRFLGFMTFGITAGLVFVAGRWWFGKDWMISVGAILVVFCGFFAITTPKSRFRKKDRR